MSIQEQIETKLKAGTQPSYLLVENDSHKHNVPVGSESHFHVVVVSQQFEGQRLIARHRKINQLLEQELKGSVHALSIHAYTQAEWVEQGGVAPDSPDCKGGS